MLRTLFEFFSFTDPNIRYVVLGSVLLAMSSAIVGTFSFLKKKALVGDAVAHAVLPGVCLAFMLVGEKNPLALIVGSFITGTLSLLVMNWITRYSKIKEDAATGLVLSVFFGAGILLLTAIQHSGNAEQSGLESFLFGKAASLIGNDLIIFGVVAVLLIVTTFLFFKEFTLFSFDTQFATVIGLPVKALELLLTVLTVMAVVVGIQAVGVVLMAAMLITPVAAARFWTDRLSVLVSLSAAIGAFSGVFGAFISYTEPKMPTGPWIVLIASLIAMISFFFAPKKGIVAKMLTQRSNRVKIFEENVLKTLYGIGEKENNFFIKITVNELVEKRFFPKNELKTCLKRLASNGFVKAENDAWVLTTEGKTKGQRITKLHRLWEVYLTEYLRIAPDHVHDDAENIEHIITPEIETRLERLLRYPDKDPHDTKIPY